MYAKKTLFSFRLRFLGPYYIDKCLLLLLLNLLAKILSLWSLQITFTNVGHTASFSIRFLDHCVWWLWSSNLQQFDNTVQLDDPGDVLTANPAIHGFRTCSNNWFWNSILLWGKKYCINQPVQGYVLQV